MCIQPRQQPNLSRASPIEAAAKALMSMPMIPDHVVPDGDAVVGGEIHVHFPHAPDDDAARPLDPFRSFGTWSYVVVQPLKFVAPTGNTEKGVFRTAEEPKDDEARSCRFLAERRQELSVPAAA
jgi:hypothetical protein